MTNIAQLKICRLYEGQSISKVLYALDIAQKHIDNKKLATRLKLANYEVGESNGNNM